MARPAVIESARLSRLRHLVTDTALDVLTAHGVAMPGGIEVEDRPGRIRVRLVFDHRVPGYVRNDLTAEVLEALRPVTRYPVANCVQVVCRRPDRR